MLAYPGKRIFADAVKDLERRAPWITQMDYPNLMTNVLIETEEKTE